MTALRALMIELGLADDVSNKLRNIDSQINGLESGLIDTQSEFSALEDATKDYGYAAGKEIAGVKDDIDALDREVGEHADITRKAAKDAAESWGKVGAAVGAAAVATEAYLRSQQDMYYAADRIAYITDMDRREVIGLAADLNNLSFSLEDAYGVMEVGARQGLRTQSELEQYARFWDAIGTAAGEDATDLARRAVALQSVNIQAADLAETTDTLGFVMTHTNVGIGQYLNLVGDMAKKMDAYDLSIEDTAVMLAALEDRGLAAEKSTEILQSAMNKAKGDTGALYRELGITEDQVARLNEEIKGGSDYITAMGEAYNDAQTPLQWVQMEAGKIGHALGADLNPLLEVGSVAMAGMSSALLMGASAAYLYSVASTTTLLPSLAASTASAWAFTTALLANPITWIVLGIVGLGAALYLLASNWDSVSGWFMGRWDEVGAVATGAIDWIGNAWDSTVGAIVAGADWLGDKLQFFGLLFPFTAPIAGMHLLRDNWDTVVGAIGAGWNGLVGAAQDGAAWLGETIGGALSGITDLFWQYHPIGVLVRQWDEITGYLEGIDLFETGKDILLGLVGGILDVRQQAIDAVMGIGEDILNAVTGFFGISSPSRLMQEMGAAVGEGFALGVDGSMPDQIILPDAIAGEVRPGTVPGGYVAAWTEPAVSTPAGEAVYSSALTEPSIRDLTGAVTYRTSLEEPAIPTLMGEAVYPSTLTEPDIRDLAGAVTYQASLEEPRIPTLTGEVRYLSVVTDPTVADLAGVATYQAYLDDIEPDALHGEARYTSMLTEPTVADLTGAITYLATVMEPTVSPLAGTVTYQARLAEPTVRDAAGTVAYRATMDEPTIADLAGEAVYTSTLTEPSVRDLTGAITYLATVMEPMVSPLEGTVSYRATMDEPTIADLAGETRYASILDEPTIADLTGSATYLSQIAPFRVPDLRGTATYDTTITEPMIADLTGSITYLSTVLAPSVERLTGTVEYTGVLMDSPDVMSLGSQYGVRLPDIDDRVLYSGPVMGYREAYTPERDAPMMAGSTATTYAPSTTINVTAGSGDPREIATVVDRRLRQTFDRHAELYFARQRRREAL